MGARTTLFIGIFLISVTALTIYSREKKLPALPESEPGSENVAAVPAEVKPTSAAMPAVKSNPSATSALKPVAQRDENRAKSSLSSLTERLSTLQPSSKTLDLITAFGGAGKPVNKTLLAYLTMMDNESRFDYDERMELRAHFNSELVKNQPEVMKAVLSGLKLSDIENGMKPQRTVFFQIAGDMPPAENPEVNAMSFEEIQKNYTRLIQDEPPPDMERKIFAIEAEHGINPIQTAHAFMATAGNDPEATLKQIRPLLATKYPVLPAIYVRAFRERYPDFKGQVK